VYKNSRMSSHTALKYCKLESPWDLEDLVQEGRRVKCCPYFASRDLIATADIVFCPYIYLIDPKIRNTVCVNLKIIIVCCIILVSVKMFQWN
jgi:Rad3-related DNA helicase